MTTPEEASQREGTEGTGGTRSQSRGIVIIPAWKPRTPVQMNRDWKPRIFLQTLDIHIYHAVDGGGLRALYMDESLYRYTEFSLYTVLIAKLCSSRICPEGQRMQVRMGLAIAQCMLDTPCDMS